MHDHSHHEIETLMREHGPFLARLARALSADSAAAEDLVHDTWLAAMRQAPRAPLSMRGWLATVLRRRAAAVRRRLSPETGLALPESPTAAQPDEIVSQLEREQLVNGALAGLDEQYRTVLFLRYHEGLTPTAIANRTGVPVKTVKTRLGRGLEHLRRKLDAEMRLRGAEDPRTEWLSMLAPLGAGSGAFPLVSVFVMKKAILIFGVLLLVGAAIHVAVRRGDGARLEGDQTTRTPWRDQQLARGGEDDVGDADPAVAAPGIDTQRVPAPDTAAQDGRATLTVSIVDASEQPLGGCTIAVKRTSTDGTPQMALIGAADARGEVTFRGLEPGGFWVLEARGLSKSHVSLEPDAHARVRLVVEQSLRVHGVVRMHDGSPAIAATIWGQSPYSKVYVPVGLTSSAGAFDLLAGPGLTVQASLAGYLPSFSYAVASLVETDEDERSVKMTLGKPGATLKGRVLDADGLPITSATVTAGPRQRVRAAGSQAIRPLPISASTGSDGCFVYAQALPGGRHDVVATAPGYATRTESVEFGGSPVEIDMILTRGATIEGTLILPDGRPAADAEVVLATDDLGDAHEARGPAHSTRTDAAGRFVLRYVPTGDVRLRCTSGWDDPLARLSVTIESLDVDETRSVKFHLSDQPVIAGQVADRSGLPMAGIWIEAKKKWGHQDTRAVESDAAGRFRITAIEPRGDGDGEWAIEAWARYRRGRTLLGRTDGIALGTLDVRIVIDRPVPADAFITGRFTNAGRRLPADMEFILWRDGQSSGSFLEVDLETGVFRHGPIVAGTYRIEVRRIDLSITMLPGVTVAPGETVQAANIPVDVVGSARVTFHLGEEGAPLQESLLTRLQGERIDLRRGDGGHTVRIEGEDGVWEHDGLPADTWSLELRDSHSFIALPVTFEVNPREVTSVRVEVLPARRVSVVTSLPDDGSWTWATLTYERPDQTGIRSGVTITPRDVEDSSRAVFRVTVAPGPARFTISTDGEGTVTATHEIPADGAADEVFVVGED